MSDLLLFSAGCIVFFLGGAGVILALLDKVRQFDDEPRLPR
jgi:hypothetical protein